MAQTIPRCVNHPDTETRLSCSSCGDPICVRCMRPAAVGQKCPRCARQPRRARALGKPVHYVRAVAAGLGVALAGGVVTNLLLAQLPFGGFILPALLGFLVGRAVGWGAARQSQQPFLGIAIGLGVLGALVALGFSPGTFGLLGIAGAAWFAARGLQSA